MKNYLQLGGVVVLFGFCFFVSSCEEEDSPVPLQPRIEAWVGDEFSLAEQCFLDLKWIVDQAKSENMSVYKNGAPPKSDCATITTDSSSNKFTIDFGKNNCLCKDLRTRRGKLEVSFIGEYGALNSAVTIRPQRYFVNEHEVRGMIISSAIGLDAKGAQCWQLRIDGAILSPNSKDSTVWSSDQILHWINGDQTPEDWSDDEWDITGRGNLITKDGYGWKANIDKPLHRLMDCRFIDKGAAELVRPGLVPHVVTYGNGSCDDKAEVRIKNDFVSIKLR